MTFIGSLFLTLSFGCSDEQDPIAKETHAFTIVKNASFTEATKPESKTKDAPYSNAYANLTAELPNVTVLREKGANLSTSDLQGEWIGNCTLVNQGYRRTSYSRTDGERMAGND